MDRTDADVDDTKRRDDNAQSSGQQNGEIVTGDLKFDGRVILYILKGKL